MADIVNLSVVKKRRQRAAEAQKAAENRVRYGRSKLQKANQARAAERRVAALDGARADPTSQNPASDTARPKF